MVKVPQWFINLWNEGFYDEEEQIEAIGTAFTKKNIEPERCRGGGSHIPLLLFNLVCAKDGWLMEKMPWSWPLNISNLSTDFISATVSDLVSLFDQNNTYADIDHKKTFISRHKYHCYGINFLYSVKMCLFWLV